MSHAHGMVSPWKLFRIALWLAIVAFLAAGVAGLVEERLGWSDDPRWNAYCSGLALTFLSLVGAAVAKIVAASRKQPSRFPTRLLLVAIAVGFLVMLAHILLSFDDMGPMGVV